MDLRKKNTELGSSKYGSHNHCVTGQNSTYSIEVQVNWWYEGQHAEMLLVVPSQGEESPKVR